MEDDHDFYVRRPSLTQRANVLISFFEENAIPYENISPGVYKLTRPDGKWIKYTTNNRAYQGGKWLSPVYENHVLSWFKRELRSKAAF